MKPTKIKMIVMVNCQIKDETIYKQIIDKVSSEQKRLHYEENIKQIQYGEEASRKIQEAFEEIL